MSQRKILVAVDFSHVCDQVLECASKHVKELQAEAIVVYAVPSYLEFAADAIPHHYLHKMMEEQATDAKAKMESIMPRYFPQGSYTARILEGYPADVILQVARDEDVNLIVVGSHGHRLVEDAFLGSVAEKVLRKAHTSVLVVRCSDNKAAAPGSSCCGGGKVGCCG